MVLLTILTIRTLGKFELKPIDRDVGTDYTIHEHTFRICEIRSEAMGMQKPRHISQGYFASKSRRLAGHTKSQFMNE